MTTQVQPVLLRRTSTPGVVPAASEFNLNTFVINNADGLLFYLDSTSTVQSIPIYPGLASAEQTIASAATTDLGSKNSNYVAISGSTTITSFGTKVNQAKFIRFTGALTLTHNATSLILPTAANIATAAGDVALAVSNTSGNWKVYFYQKADGTSLVASGTSTGAVRYDQAQTLTGTQRKQAKQNIGARTAGYDGFSGAATLTVSQINEAFYCFTGGYTITFPAVANFLNGDTLEFSNQSNAAITLSRAAGDTALFYYDKAATASTYVLQPGASCTVMSDGINFVVVNSAPSRVGSIALDYGQALTAAQMTQLITNLGLAPVAQTYAAAKTLDFSTFLNATITLTGNITFANPSNLRVGQAGEIVVTQDATGSRTIAFGSQWKFIGGTPTATTTANGVDVISYRVISSTLIVCGFGKGVA